MITNDELKANLEKLHEGAKKTWSKGFMPARKYTKRSDTCCLIGAAAIHADPTLCEASFIGLDKAATIVEDHYGVTYLLNAYLIRGFDGDTSLKDEDWVGQPLELREQADICFEFGKKVAEEIGLK